ncbi:hypothetical protein PUNSTDRAFT_122599 [Punctularia strigosozonata HHB-11173 SS5]|uniref:Tubby C-terminal domain-containing protein n=1 Tax=Punctularia strigosozonata (strain HHB-11173) TaxID=741275 RepID=R7S397_PUNST|nr:uncharacterized protein PUNSTDRAFT_122599 [Punctularia strigosozonata HHB-11173 SS5]EIN04880.1 hypothetical protein PUNSTDRAFT_122599 [Punctularia strigosozonata HHB-11173 SS5]
MSLAPAPHAVGVFPTYSRHRSEVALKIREKKLSFTGDDFDITDAATGAKVFHVDGKVFSLQGRKEISDAAGNRLFTLLKSHFHIYTTFHGKGPASDATIFTVKSFSKAAFSTAKAKNTYNDVPVARIRQVLQRGSTAVILTVAPGVNFALLAAFCICLDKKANEQ